MSGCSCGEANCPMDAEEESSLPSLPPPPPFAPTNEQLIHAMNKVFDQYPGMRMNMPMVVTTMLQDLRPNVTQYRQAEGLVVDFIRAQAHHGVLSIVKGPKGGIMRIGTLQVVNDKHGYPFATIVVPKVESVLQSASSAPAINNHTCPSCGNTACSKDERSCWKCGGSL